MTDSHQKHRLTHGIGDVLALDHGLGHARKTRELVHHAADIVHLANDSIGALLEHRLVLDNQLAEFAPDALSGKLDRGQRVFDLMRNAARDVTPGRGALRGDQFSNIIEGDDVAVARTTRRA